jgi:outer membrane protein
MLFAASAWPHRVARPAQPVAALTGKMLARNIPATAFFVAAAMIAPASAAVFTLRDALVAAYQTNPQLEAARARLRAVDEEVAQANALWRPSINATGSYGAVQSMVSGIPSPTASQPLIGQVAISQPIFSGGRIGARIGRANEDVEAGRGELAATEQAVLLGAAQAYIDLLRDEAVVARNQDNVRTLQSRLGAVRTQFNAGAVTRTDVNQVEARFALARAALTSADLQQALSRAAFESVIGRPAETLEEAPPPAGLPPSKESALAVAGRESPGLVRARAMARASDYAVDEAVGALLPQLSLSAQYQYLRDAAAPNIYVLNGVQQNLALIGQLTIPIYQGGGEEAGVRRAGELRAQSEAAILVAERAVRQEVEGAWQSFASAQAALASSRTAAEADQAAVEGVTEEQKGGERSVLDILNAQAELVTAQIAVETARHDVGLAGYRLLAAMGQMRAAALKLPVPLYDPADHYNKSANAWFGLGD